MHTFKHNCVGLVDMRLRNYIVMWDLVSGTGMPDCKNKIRWMSGIHGRAKMLKSNAKLIGSLINTVRQSADYKLKTGVYWAAARKAILNALASWHKTLIGHKGHEQGIGDILTKAPMYWATRYRHARETVESREAVPLKDFWAGKVETAHATDRRTTAT